MPLNAKQMLDASHTFVYPVESRQHLPEIALLVACCSPNTGAASLLAAGGVGGIAAKTAPRGAA